MKFPMLFLLAGWLLACSARPGANPVPPRAIASAADTHVPDAGDAAAAPADSAR